VKHSGDNRTGEGDGDDECISVDLDNLPSNIRTIVFVITAYDKGDFTGVETAHAQMRDITGGQKKSLASISIGCQGKHTALIACIVYRGT
jgi:tellurium resistance protein TerZ